MAEASPEVVELQFLSSLTTAQRVREAQAAGIDALSFQMDSHVTVWEYLTLNAGKDKDTSHGDILAVCNVECVEDVSDTETLTTMLRDLSVHRRALQVILEHGEALDSDPDQAVADIIENLSILASPKTIQHEERFERDAEARMERVLTRVEQVRNEGYTGIPTGFPYFDEEGDTWKPGELVAIVGATNSGKSWFLLEFGAHAYVQYGKKVLFLSPENTVDDIEARLDAIVSRKLGHDLRAKAIRNGTVDPVEYAAYISDMQEKIKGEWITRDSGASGGFTVQDIVSLTRQHKPDILCLDGFHLISSTELSSWERMKYAADTLKGLAQDLGITIITVSQAQRDAVLAPDDAPELGQIAYGMALGEACNRVLSLAEKKGQSKQRIFKVIKHRDAVRLNERVHVTFDVDRGYIAQEEVNVDDDGFVRFD